MKSIREYLRSVLLSASELDALQESQKKPLNITKDITMALTVCGPISFNTALPGSLASLPEVKKVILQTAINDLFTSGHFSICKVDAMLDVLNVSRKSDAYKHLSTLHCVHYNKMPDNLKAILPQLLNEAFSGSQDCRAGDIALKGIL